MNFDQIVIDSRRIDSKNALFVALKGSQSDGHRYVRSSGAKYALVHKDFNEECPGTELIKVEDPLKAFQDIAKEHRKEMPCKVIAIIGSYGKTMVKDLLQALLETTYETISSPESFNSQIGVPLSLLRIKKNHQIAIIEAAISEVGEMEKLAEMICPDFAILTPIGKKYLPIKTLLEEMEVLLKTIPKENWAMTPEIWNTPSESLPFTTLSSPTTYKITFPDGSIHAGSIPTGFSYFADLLNMAIKPAWKLGITKETLCKVIDSYIPEPMRTEIWQSQKGATFINDTYCSDPQSIDVSLKYFHQFPESKRKIFLFGGLKNENKSLLEYRRIGESINKSGINRLIVVGNTPLPEFVKSIEVTKKSSYESALQLIKNEMQPGDTILIKGDKKQPLDTLTAIFNDSISTNQCFINLAAIQANINTLRKHLPKGTRLLVMIKADAYGTNYLRLATFLKTCGIDIFGVSYVDEGVALRQSGITESIFVLNAAPYEAAKIAKYNLEVGVGDKLMIEALAGNDVKVHLHVDTGMSRLGCRPEETLELTELIQHHNLKLEGIFTHLACAENPNEDPFTLKQIQIFDTVIEKLKISIPWKHACNSSAISRFSFPQYNMVRIGLAIYGLYASLEVKNSLDLRLAVSLTSRIVGINHCKKGETVSYGRNYTVTKDNQRIAVVPIGYYDGLHRNYSGKGYAIIRGQKAPMIGTICMDYMMLDISMIPLASTGDTVLIFGEDEYGNYLPPEELASSGNSIIYELMTCLGPRIQRVFIYEEANRVR